MAGLLRKDFQDTVRQFPLLGSLPIIGTLVPLDRFPARGDRTGDHRHAAAGAPVRAGALKVPTDRVGRRPTRPTCSCSGRTDGAVGADPGRSATISADGAAPSASRSRRRRSSQARRPSDRREGISTAMSVRIWPCALAAAMPLLGALPVQHRRPAARLGRSGLRRSGQVQHGDADHQSRPGLSGGRRPARRRRRTAAAARPSAIARARSSRSSAVTTRPGSGASGRNRRCMMRWDAHSFGMTTTAAVAPTVALSLIGTDRGRRAGLRLRPAGRARHRTAECRRPGRAGRRDPARRTSRCLRARGHRRGAEPCFATTSMFARTADDGAADELTTAIAMQTPTLLLRRYTEVERHTGGSRDDRRQRQGRRSSTSSCARRISR